MQQFDITLLTDRRYLATVEGDWYVENILTEDKILRAALEKQGFKVTRTNWDDPNFDWSSTKYALFRTTWDYFDRFPSFSKWLNATSKLTTFLNPEPLLRWNMDKHYLLELAENGIPIPPTLFIETGDRRLLSEILDSTEWDDFVLKPAVSGAGRHTYRLNRADAEKYQTIYAELIAEEAMILQEFMHNVPRKGEIAFMVMAGKFTHAVLKRAKEGDFRVQDDFGGTLHDYSPSQEEIEFAENAVKACPSLPYYARVDVIWNNQNEMVISELEMIEPELWFRRMPEAADVLAQELKSKLMD